jgi:hypothetical protein
VCNIESSVAVTENFVRAETIQRTLDAVERPHSVARITAAITSWLYALTRPITPHAQAHAALCSITIVSARSLLIGKPGFDVLRCAVLPCFALGWLPTDVNSDLVDEDEAADARGVGSWLRGLHRDGIIELSDEYLGEIHSDSVPV